VELDAIALAARQPKALDQLGDAFARNVGGNLVQVGEVTEVVEAGEPPVEAALATEHEADAAPDGPWVRDDVEAKDPGAARRRQQLRGEDLHHGRLAGAIR